MEKSDVFFEIFGVDALVTPAKVPQQLASLPFDNPLYPMTKGTGAADALCKRLQDDAFVADILGTDYSGKQPHESRFLPRFSSPAEAEFLKGVLGDIEPGNAGVRIFARPRKGDRESRKLHLARVVSEMRDKPAFDAIKYSDGWEHLLNSSVGYVENALAGKF